MAAIIFPSSGVRVPAAQLDQETKAVLSNWFPVDILQQVDLEVRVPGRIMPCCPSASATAPEALMKVGGNPGPNQIVIHPQFYDPNTASGLALIGHEIFHVMQRRQVSNFARRFTDAAIETERAGSPPWSNPFEAEAYEFERRIKKELIQRGFPAGSLSSSPGRSLLRPIFIGAAIGAGSGVLGEALKPRVMAPAAEQAANILIAKGDSLDDVRITREGTVSDRAIMEIELRLTDIPFIDRLFDASGVESLIRPAMPDGLELIDVRGERDSRGPLAIITARAVPQPGAFREPSFVVTGALVLLIAKILAGTVVGGFVLGLIVVGVRFLVSLFQAAGDPLGDALPFIIAGGGVLVLFGLLATRRAAGSPSRG